MNAYSNGLNEFSPKDCLKYRPIFRHSAQTRNIELPFHGAHIQQFNLFAQRARFQYSAEFLVSTKFTKYSNHSCHTYLPKNLQFINILLRELLFFYSSSKWNVENFIVRLEPYSAKTTARQRMNWKITYSPDILTQSIHWKDASLHKYFHLYMKIVGI